MKKIIYLFVFITVIGAAHAMLPTKVVRLSPLVRCDRSFWLGRSQEQRKEERHERIEEIVQKVKELGCVKLGRKLNSPEHLSDLACYENGRSWLINRMITQKGFKVAMDRRYRDYAHRFLECTNLWNRGVVQEEIERLSDRFVEDCFAIVKECEGLSAQASAQIPACVGC